MGVSLQFAERRKNPRFTIGKTAYVVNATNPGLITDISLNGLSWRYVHRKTGAGEPKPTLDIVIDDLDFHLRDLPYTVVSDCEAEHDCPDSSLVVRRRSVRFGELSAWQQAALQELIGFDLYQPIFSGQLVN